MNSMTGYGSSQTKNRQVEIEVHVKSVNGRYFETRFHLPKEYAPFENELKKCFKGWSRGTVDIYVHRRPGADSKLKSVALKTEAAKYWAASLKKLSKELKLSTDVSLRDILQMPHVMESNERVQLFPGEIKQLEKQLKGAIQKCQQFRTREGGVLKKELLSLIRHLEDLVTDMSGWREEAMKTSHQRLKSRLATLEAEELDASRLALETALMIDKMDVHEEVVRLLEHIKACRELLQEGDAKGKKLDFYCQELLREVNTIGSKSQLASLTKVVVEAKSTIEKFREQVQNIE